MNRGLARAIAWIGVGLLSTAPISTPGFADTPAAAARRFFVGLGALTSPLNEYTSSTSGAPSFFSGVAPTLNVLGAFPVAALPNTVSLLANLALTPWGHDTPDHSEQTQYLEVSTELSWSFLRAGPGDLELKAGPGLLATIVSGKGGSTAVMVPGDSGTYPLPQGSSSSELFTLDGGVGLSLPCGASSLRVDLDSILSDPFSSRISFNLLAQVSYGIF